MNPELTRLIEQYLSGELSESDKALFEQRLAESETLRKETELQQLVHEGARRSAQRAIIQQTAKSYHFRKNLLTTAIIVAAAGIIAASVYFAARNPGTANDPITERQFRELEAKLDEQVPMENIPAEYFRLGKKDTIVLSQGGVLLSVPETAFLLNGKSYSGPKVIQWQEATDAAAIVKGGLSTLSGTNLLETQGMFGVQAFTPDGKKLGVNPKVGIYVQVPVDEVREGMQLFEGKPGTNGRIDWQNPQPLEKLPVAAAMNDLDFYPPGYGEKLDRLKWKTGRKQRDSLYLTFEEEEVDVPDIIGYAKDEATADSIPVRWARQWYIRPYWGVVNENNEDYNWNEWIVFTDETHATMDVELEMKKAVSPPDHPKLNFNPSGAYSILSAERSKAPTAGGTKFIYRYKLKINTEEPFSIKAAFGHPLIASEKIDMQVGKPYGKVASGNHIPPAKVLAFWNPKFNNTILATRDFEKRMRAVHGTCKEEVLKQYTGSLNSPLYEVDERVAAMGYPEFKAFAAERVGKVELNNAHGKKLNEFYENASAELKAAIKKDRDFLRKQEQAWDQSVERQRSEEMDRRTGRNVQSYKEEYDLNYENASKQLGYRHTKQLTGPSVGFTITSNVAAWNLDKFVADVTAGRTTGTFTDAVTGRKATITYNDFSASVKSPEKYGRLFLYLFPHELNSFQRIDPVKGNFSYRLNNAVLYDLAIVGISEEGFYLHTTTGLRKGALGVVDLDKLSEREFTKAIERLNKGRISKPAKISEELSWLSKEKADYTVQRLRKEQAAFRRELRKVIFPCEESLTGQGVQPQSREIDIN